MERKLSEYKMVMMLIINNITKSDIGTYTCIAQNTKGKSEDSARLYGKLKFYLAYKYVKIKFSLK